MIRRMARYNRKPLGIDGWPIPNDGQLRVFGREALGMTNQQINEDIQDAHDTDIYPRVELHGSETLIVEIGTVVIRDDEGFWGSISEERLAEEYDEDNGQKSATATPL